MPLLYPTLIAKLQANGILSSFLIIYKICMLSCLDKLVCKILLVFDSNRP